MARYIDIDKVFKVLDDGINEATKYNDICMIRNLKSLLDVAKVEDVIPRDQTKWCCPKCGARLETIDNEPEDKSRCRKTETNISTDSDN